MCVTGIVTTYAFRRLCWRHRINLSTLGYLCMKCKQKMCHQIICAVDSISKMAVTTRMPETSVLHQQNTAQKACTHFSVYIQITVILVLTCEQHSYSYRAIFSFSFSHWSSKCSPRVLPTLWLSYSFTLLLLLLLLLLLRVICPCA